MKILERELIVKAHADAYRQSLEHNLSHHDTVVEWKKCTSPERVLSIVKRLKPMDIGNA